ncbi:Piso0_000208 [Millerozyma farinosa CBS 7064]|uniref:Piso0_000208 protein n=1 Tax=Pichia sorbitophila (strain ATCC MYA-4447 / BCRC 22081 / CBS 7064 / NBRC 10061 / NRRL Y-12695) TaxID=559304 RepID=G8YTD4_PICSO|nr:Piso0_000208 [Millerozyma farinosa CBS 7064]
MLKRALSMIWNSEKGNTNKVLDYERWSKSQLIERIRELESHEQPQEIESEPKAVSSKPENRPKQFDFGKHSKRFIAIKFAYLGWNYSGLSFQYEPAPLPTVEEEILKALEKAKIIPAVDPLCCDLSRCGRTDRGVSAMNQVMSLTVRSNLAPEEQDSTSNDGRELPYLAILNSLLPPDIRVTAVCLHPPPNFNARFSCLYRQYRYFFRPHDLDVELMSKAAKKYEGVHDFRSFCKIDGSKQITNYKREILSADVLPYDDELYMLELKGTAFLWHQVRCMAAVLFLVGQKHESIDVIDELLNVDKYPSKPNYEMANDIPLVLFDCVYPSMEWITPDKLSDKTPGKILKENAKVRELALDYSLKAHIAQTMERMFVLDPSTIKAGNGGYINVGDGKGRNFKKYIPLERREVGESFDVVNKRYRQKKKRKVRA